METQQMMELLLARMNASMKEHMQEMTARMDANQADQARMEANKEDMLARTEENMKDIKSSQAKMRSTICAFRSELKETMKRETRAVIQYVRSELDDTIACNRATETEPNP
jgi:hypothetical protein